ncbi:AMP-binding protein [Nonomuraea fuscirosea]|uniref:AMP-binding protein n=1 Tax=Nonomuraea fuscirosea TaxID=1291556 RepID=UPI0034406AFF
MTSHPVPDERLAAYRSEGDRMAHEPNDLPEPAELKMSVATALRAAAQAAGDRPAMIQGERTVGYAELDERAARLAGALAGHGVGPGSTVAIGLYNSFAYLETIVAAFKLGARPVNINYRYRAPELRYVLDYTDAAAFVHDTSLAAHVREVPGDRLLLEVGAEAEPLAPVVPFERAVEHEPVHRDAAAGSPHGIILLTGGTTGRPKGVIWDRDGLLGILRGVFRQAGLEPPQTPDEVRTRVRELRAKGGPPVVLPMSPLMHGTGLFHALRTLLAGGTICFCTSRSLDAEEVWRTVERHAVTEMVIVGDAFGRPLVDALAAAERAGRPYDIGSLRSMTSSGVIWSAEVKRELLRRGGMTLIDNISASEGGPFGQALARSEADVADGRFTLSPVARILDENDQDIKPGTGQVGVLASAGPQPVGYLKDPERTARVWRTIDGVRYAVPGDLASLDADGRLILLGRGDGVINTGGEKVFPEEVEEALVTHPSVSEAVVVGVPDPRWGQIVVAVVAPADALAEVEDEALSRHVGERLAGYKRPRAIVRVEAIPRSPAGKINRPSARELAVGHLRPATKEATP